MSDHRESRLVSGSATYLVANALSATIPFLLLPVLTRFMPPEDYGRVAMFQVMISAMSALAGLNVHGAATRKYYDHPANDREMAGYIGSCLLILAVSSMALWAAILVLAQPLTRWVGLETPWLLAAMAVAAATMIANLRLGQWQVRRKPVQYGTFQVSMGLVAMASSLVLVVGLRMGAEGRLLAQIGSATAFAALAIWLLWRDGLLRLHWNPEEIREALKFGVPLIPHVAGLFLLTVVDRLVINTRFGLEAAGIYLVAVQVTLVLNILFDSINKAYVPWLFERLGRDRPDEKRQIVRLTYGYFGVALALAGCVALLGPVMIVWIAGEPYAAAGGLIGWLALGQAFNGMYLMVTNYVFYSKRTGLLSLATISSGILNVGLLVGLTGLLGIEGAPIAFAISMFIRFLLTWVVAHRRHPMPWLSP